MHALLAYIARVVAIPVTIWPDCATPIVASLASHFDTCRICEWRVIWCNMQKLLRPFGCCVLLQGCHVCIGDVLLLGIDVLLRSGYVTAAWYKTGVSCCILFERRKRHKMKRPRISGGSTKGSLSRTFLCVPWRADASRLYWIQFALIL